MSDFERHIRREPVRGVYEIVEDDVELSAVLKVFEELLEDVEIER